jgi:hypothetical protein
MKLDPRVKTALVALVAALSGIVAGMSAPDAGCPVCPVCAPIPQPPVENAPEAAGLAPVSVDADGEPVAPDAPTP